MHSMHIAHKLIRFLVVVRDDRDCRHQLLQRMLHAAAAAVALVTKPLLLSLEMTFLKIAMHAMQHSNKSEVETSEGKRSY